MVELNHLQALLRLMVVKVVLVQHSKNYKMVLAHYLQLLPIVSGMLEKYGIRDKVKLAASGKLVTPDKIAIALGLGAVLLILHVV